MLVLSLGLAAAAAAALAALLAKRAAAPKLIPVPVRVKNK